MRLFGKSPWAADGVRTVATIERVMVTEIGVGEARGGGTQADNEVVYLALRFTDEQGGVVVHERRANLRPEKIPGPGWSILVVYVAGKPETVDYDPRVMRPPDPSVPRGWGAGIFEVEDLGTHRAKSPIARRAIDKQRELFRSGRRAQAEVMAVDAPAYRLGLRLKRGASEITLKLRANGGDIQTKAWVPAACVPEPGDLIEIAVSPDGSEVALDSDERYDGPPGQALVFKASPELAARRPPLPPIDVNANKPWTAEQVQQFAAANVARVAAMPQGPANLQATLAASAKQALAATTDPAQRQVIIQQYRAMGIELGEDE